MSAQSDLFGAPLEPQGLRFAPALVDAPDQAALIEAFAALPFAPFVFHGWLGARRVVAFGRDPDVAGARPLAADPLPAFLHAVRDSAAAFAGVAPETVAQALVTEYAPGAGIGWHRDRAGYDKIIGLSFGAPCRLRFRRPAGAAWDRRDLELPPGSAYLLDGAARRDWEHGIAPMTRLRWSVTFRTLARGQA